MFLLLTLSNYFFFLNVFYTYIYSFSYLFKHAVIVSDYTCVASYDTTNDDQ